MIFWLMKGSHFVSPDGHSLATWFAWQNSILTAASIAKCQWPTSMTRYDKAWLSSLLAKPGYSLPADPKHKGGGPRSCLQKRQDDGKGATHNPPQETKMDGTSLSRYRITITLLVSDNRDRDGDGGISTLLDTYLFALGRFLGLDRGALRGLAKSEERRGRGDH